MLLDYFALGLMLFGSLVSFYLIIAIHDIPYVIATHRNHPHQAAIYVAGWVSLLTLHAIWPFLWIWATLYRPDRGYGFGRDAGSGSDAEGRVAALESRIAALEAALGPRHGAGDGTHTVPTASRTEV